MKSERKRLSRFKRLMELDQRRLDESIEALKAANARVEIQESAVRLLVAEQLAELEAQHGANIALQSQRTVWLVWSRAELSKANALLGERQSEQSQCRAMFQHWTMRVKAWEKLTERLVRRIQTLELKAESIMADDLATCRKRPFLFQKNQTTQTAATIEGTLP
jgi:flagellar biosynthesis chaperone FliJ